MEYTISKKANKKIAKDMEIIISEIRKKYPEIISIILSGGFSRGKGPVKIEGNNIYPYNDYDIQIISKNKICKDMSDKLSIEISKKLGYRGIDNFYPFKKEEQKIKDNFYIDLKWDSLKDLKKLLPRIRNYELKKHSKIIYGKDVRKIIPEYSLKDMPLSEGAKLLLDRMSQMVEYYSEKGDYEQECLSYFIQQCYAACCTSLLLLSGKYQIGYEKSMKILKETYEKDFPGLFKKIPNLHNKVEYFVNWKINPKKPIIKNLEEEWFIAKNNLIEVTKYFFSIFLKKRINNVEELSRSILRMDKEFYIPYINSILKNKIGIKSKSISKILIPIVKIILIKKYKKRLMQIEGKKIGWIGNSPDLIIFASLPFLINSIKKEGVNLKELNECKRLLNKVYPVKGNSWEEISIEYANAYILFFLQKI